MTQAEFLKKIDETVKGYDLRRHPFYLAWTEGKLTQDDLREYAMEYFHQVSSFPKYLREFARRLPAGELRHVVYQNLCDEEGLTGCDSRSHAAIWTVFAQEMGASPLAMRSRAPLPKTQQLIDIFFEQAEFGSKAEVLATLYAYESQIPKLAADKASSLRRHYGASEAACEYFDLHSTIDIRHANFWGDQLLRSIDQDPTAVTHALVAADLAGRALWRALDGINARRASTLP